MLYVLATSVLNYYTWATCLSGSIMMSQYACLTRGLTQFPFESNKQNSVSVVTHITNRCFDMPIEKVYYKRCGEAATNLYST
jgi:hypothetical protein